MNKYYQSNVILLFYFTVLESLSISAASIWWLLPLFIFSHDISPISPDLIMMMLLIALKLAANNLLTLRTLLPKLGEHNLDDIELWYFTKATWSYNHEIISIIQDSLNVISAFESSYCPCMMVTVLVDMNFYVFLQSRDEINCICFRPNLTDVC